MIIFIVRQLFREGRLIRERLTDYVRLGWLPESDPRALSRLRTRFRALWHAIFKGPDTFLATIRMQRAVTELAYLRDAMTRGLIDDTGLVREKELLAKIRAIRPEAIVLARGACRVPVSPQAPGGSLAAYAPPSYPGPAGLAATTRPRFMPGTACPRGVRCGSRAVGADCYPVLGGRPQLETARERRREIPATDRQAAHAAGVCPHRAADGCRSGQLPLPLPGADEQRKVVSGDHPAAR